MPRVQPVATISSRSRLVGPGLAEIHHQDETLYTVPLHREPVANSRFIQTVCIDILHHPHHPITGWIQSGGGGEASSRCRQNTARPVPHRLATTTTTHRERFEQTAIAQDESCGWAGLSSRGANSFGAADPPSWKGNNHKLHVCTHLHMTH